MNIEKNETQIDKPTNLEIYNDGQLYLIVDLESTNMNELIESLKQTYDENTINNALIYNLNQIAERLNYIDEVALGKTGLIATKGSDDTLHFNKKSKEDVTENFNIQPINKNEYVIQPNPQGGYDLLLGGVGLGAHEIIDLINELKLKGIVPVSAEVTPHINGEIDMAKINENAQRFTDERLENNYDMSVNSYCEIGLNPSEEDHHKTR